jgi:Cu+-exporting ATPase
MTMHDSGMTMQDATAEAGDALDPVCGMTVDIGEARSRNLVSDHDGTTYFFCSKGCKLDFEEDPHKYLDPSYVPSM